MAHNPCAAASNGSTFSADPSYFIATKLTELQNPKPAETWVSIDENADSINDGALLPPSNNLWPDLPANYHDGGATVAFADGRAEVHRWQGSALNVSVKYINQNNFAAPPNDPDIQWLRHRTPRKPGAN